MASLRFVSQKLISPTAQADLTNYMTVINTSGLGTVSNPYITKGFNYYGCLYGNAFSAEQGFATIGSLSSTSQVNWDQNLNIYPWWSSTKLFTAMVYAKMVEDGFLTSNDTIASYITTGFAGNMYYITNGAYPATPINVNGQPGNPAAWTVTTSTFNASTLTLNTLLNFNLGLLYDGYQYGLVGESTVVNNTGCVNADTLAGTEYGKNLAYTCFKMNQYILANGSGNYLYSAMTGATTPLYKNSLYSILAQVANGTIPLAWSPNSNIWGGQNLGSSTTADLANANVTQTVNNYVTTQLQNYGPCYEILGCCMDNKIRALYASNPVTYPWANLAAYARAKLFTPLQMTRSYICGQELPSLTTPTPNITNLLFDPAAWLVPTQVARSNLTSLGGNFAYTNLLSSANPQNVTISSCYSAPTTGAALAGVVLLGSNTANVTSSGAAYGVIQYNVSDDSFVKYVNNSVLDPANSNETYIGGMALVGSIADFAKMIICLLNGGKNQAGQRVLNKQSIEWLFKSRTSAMSPILNNSVMSVDNDVHAIGCSIGNNVQSASDNDLISNSYAGWGGATNNFWFMDRVTGYYAIYGSNLVNLWSQYYNGCNLSVNTVLRNIINKNA